MTLVNEPINRGEIRKKYCRFKKHGIKYIDYKDPNFLLKFVNEQGKILPRRLTGNSAKVSEKSGSGHQKSKTFGFVAIRNRWVEIISCIVQSQKNITNGNHSKNRHQRSWL